VVPSFPGVHLGRSCSGTGRGLGQRMFNFRTGEPGHGSNGSGGGASGRWRKMEEDGDLWYWWVARMTRKHLKIGGSGSLGNYFSCA